MATQRDVVLDAAFDEVFLFLREDGREGMIGHSICLQKSQPGIGHAFEASIHRQSTECKTIEIFFWSLVYFAISVLLVERIPQNAIREVSKTIPSTEKLIH
jgi:hypothetical protein